MSFQTAVYLLCFLTSATCAALLTRSYLKTGARLLLWSGLSFSALAVNSAFVVADMVVLPSVDLLLWRHLAALAAASVLLYGFIWEAK